LATIYSHAAFSGLAAAIAGFDSTCTRVVFQQKSNGIRQEAIEKGGKEREKASAFIV
jgi:hypothetical protein